MYKPDALVMLTVGPLSKSLNCSECELFPVCDLNQTTAETIRQKTFQILTRRVTSSHSFKFCDPTCISTVRYLSNVGVITAL